MRFVRRRRYHTEDPARPESEPPQQTGRHLGEVVRAILGIPARERRHAEPEKPSLSDHCCTH